MGIDVGGRRKGFHLALVDAERQVSVAHIGSSAGCVERVTAFAPVLVAIDSPSEWAPDGEKSRPCEREFAGSGSCGIRFTPDADTAERRTDGYFEWIEHGLEVWDGLRSAGIDAVECFPTATWTAWLGPRAPRTRAAWTREGIARLAEHGVTGLEAATNQDTRDAVAAALTARQLCLEPSTVEPFGGMAVPRTETLASGVRPSVDGR